MGEGENGEGLSLTSAWAVEAQGQGNYEACAVGAKMVATQGAGD